MVYFIRWLSLTYEDISEINGSKLEASLLLIWTRPLNKQPFSSIKRNFVWKCVPKNQKQSTHRKLWLEPSFVSLLNWTKHTNSDWILEYHSFHFWFKLQPSTSCKNSSFVRKSSVDGVTVMGGRAHERKAALTARCGRLKTPMLVHFLELSNLPSVSFLRKLSHILVFPSLMNLHTHDI